MEIWKDIKDFEGYYQISNLGNVKSLIRKGNLHEKVLKPTKCTAGYLQVSLFKNNISYPRRIHRLIAEAFIPNPKNLPMINHINEIKTDNSVSNLEWCDNKYNCNHGTRTERIFLKERGRPVIQLSKQGEFIKEYPSARIACKETGVSQEAIRRVCNGKYYESKAKKYYNSIFGGGFKWKWKNNE